MTVGERNKKMNLTGVPETMLQTIYARAKESKGRGAICDKKAEEIVSRLDYDFSLADKDTAMHSGVIARTIVLDRLTTAWLATHPGGVVVNIAWRVGYPVLSEEMGMHTGIILSSGKRWPCV